MPVFRFRIYWEEDDSVYRDVQIRADQTFLQLHSAILVAFEFDQKHKARFFRSNDHWKRGREIVQEMDDQPRMVAPLIMADTLIGTVVTIPNQKFVYLYDDAVNWTFLVELIGLSREENSHLQYPVCIRREGLPPAQYGTKGNVNEKLVEIEEKYDLLGDKLDEEGFGEEGEEEKEEEEGEESTGEEAASPGEEGFSE
ncbi:MAG TPA: hypothetical protein VNE41_08065 [Chitinophagaceae bacterium]|nr:hypothetical protein [Chitinophagaceae bacterium]